MSAVFIWLIQYIFVRKFIYIWIVHRHCRILRDHSGSLSISCRTSRINKHRLALFWSILISIFFNESNLLTVFGNKFPPSDRRLSFLFSVSVYWFISSKVVMFIGFITSIIFLTNNGRQIIILFWVLSRHLGYIMWWLFLRNGFNDVVYLGVLLVHVIFSLDEVSIDASAHFFIIYWRRVSILANVCGAASLVQASWTQSCLAQSMGADRHSCTFWFLLLMVWVSNPLCTVDV